MGILTDDRELKLLKHMFGQEDLSIPTRLYMGLHVGAPTEASPSTNEISAGGYSRVLLVNDQSGSVSHSTSSSPLSTVFELTTSDNLTNASAIDFAEATADWGTVTHYSIWDTSNSTLPTHCLMIGALSSGVVVNDGDQFRIAVGQFDLTFPSKLGRGTTTSTTIPTQFDQYLFYDATEWRRQVARRLGFLRKPWGPSIGGVYKWDFDTNAVDSGDTDTLAERIHMRNTYWPQVSLSPFSDSYTAESTSTTGSTQGRAVNDNSLYLALYTSDPGTNFTSVASSTELSGNGYARQRLIYKTSDSSAGPSVFGTATTSGGVTSIVNDEAIAFPEATSNWGTVSHWGIYRGQSSTTWDGGSYTVATNRSGTDAAKASYPIMVGALTTARTVNSGDILRFGIGDFVIKLD